jgi:hypothetical protein
MLAAAFFLALLFSVCTWADMRVKVEGQYSLVGAPPGVADYGANTDVYYVQGSARRKDTWSGLGSHSAVIRDCGSGKSYLVDFEHKQFLELRPLKYPPNPTSQHASAEGAGPSGGSGKTPKVTILSQTVEVGKPRVILGRVARHYLTTAKQFLGEPAGAPYAEETIDAWYWPDVQRIDTSCIPENLASQPSAWIGEPDPVPGAMPIFQHSGPSPTGLTVQETRTAHTNPTYGGGWAHTTTVENKVVEFSESPQNPSLFLVPKGFRKVLNLGDLSNAR